MLTSSMGRFHISQSIAPRINGIQMVTTSNR
jgi:hypothetical protein